MHQRKSGNGRPSGTDGSDFSYRMVVDSRYTKVAKGKSQLSAFIFTQAVIQFLYALSIFLSSSNEEKIDQLAVSSTVICFIALLIGELGQKWSRTSFLKFFVIGSSVAILLSVACMLRRNIVLEVVWKLNDWEGRKFEVCKITAVILGFLVHLLTVRTTTSLIHNMAPPKRAS